MPQRTHNPRFLFADLHRGVRQWAFIMVAFALAGCGGSADQSGAGDTGSTESAGDTAAAQEDRDDRLGEPRDDLERFYGVYEGPDEPNQDIFVAKAKYPMGVDRQMPDGYMMIGAMWGDVAPWMMKSRGDLSFVQAYTNSPGQDPMAVEFEVDETGQAIGLTFTEGMLADREPLRRIDDLPEGW